VYLYNKVGMVHL